MDHPKILLAGANRGLGLGLARVFLARGWQVIATARAPGRAEALAALAESHPGRLRIEPLDIVDPPSVRALAARLDGQTLDCLFVVAGRLSSWTKPVHEATEAEITLEFVTNATAPIAVAEALAPRVRAGGLVAFMTSQLGSIAANSQGGLDLYRASKAALNMLAKNFAFRHPATPVLLMHPGWVRTEMGGKDAPLDIETSARGMADILTAPHAPGLRFLDYTGATLPW